MSTKKYINHLSRKRQHRQSVILIKQQPKHTPDNRGNDYPDLSKNSRAENFGKKAIFTKTSHRNRRNENQVEARPIDLLLIRLAVSWNKSQSFDCGEFKVRPSLCTISKCQQFKFRLSDSVIFASTSLKSNSAKLRVLMLDLMSNLLKSYTESGKLLRRRRPGFSSGILYILTFYGLIDLICLPSIRISD